MNAAPLEWVQKALSITGKYEGRGYSEVSGNFDGQGLSLGILQWCIGQGSFQASLLKPFIAAHGADAVDSLMPSKISVLLGMSNRQGVQWAIQNAMVRGSNSVKSAWEQALVKWLTSHDMVELQQLGAQVKGHDAEVMCDHFGMSSQRSYCFFFDIAVQNGSMKGLGLEKFTDSQLSSACSVSKNNAKLWRSLIPSMSPEQKQLLWEAYRRAQLANPTWAFDVMDRKGTIAVGQGVVHGAMLNLQFT